MSYVFRADRDLGGLGVDPDHPLAASRESRAAAPRSNPVGALDLATRLVAAIAAVLWIVAAIAAIAHTQGCATADGDRHPALQAALQEGINATSCALAGGVTCTAATLAACPLPRIDGAWGEYGRCLVDVGGGCLKTAGANCVRAVGATAIAALGQVRAALLVDPGGEPEDIALQRYRECIDAPAFRDACLHGRQTCERALTFCHADALGAAQVWAP